MGAVDLVVQVESPKSVARGLQRVGRAGHELGAVSRGRIFPKYRADLLESAVVVERMKAGAIEETVIPRNPLDVLAQQIVAITADEEISVDELHDLVRGAYNFADLSRVQLENVLDMLAGRYPSDEFAELRPRIVWDRTGGRDPRPRRRTPARRQNAGTIPDRGLYGVHLVDGGGRVGELDEEMVYEARAGQTFTARRIHMADRGDHARPRARLAGPGRAGNDPLLEGRGPRASVRARRADRPGLARARRAARAEGARAADERALARRAGGPEPAHVPRRPAERDRSRALGSHGRRRALPRRDRRLAHVRPDALRRPRARTVVDGDRGQAPRRAGHRGAVALVGRRDRDPPARRGRTAANRGAVDRPDRDRGPRDERARLDRALRLSLPRERGPRAPDPAAQAGGEDAALAAAPQGAGPAPGRAQVRLVPGHPRDVPRVPAGRLRPARAEAPAQRAQDEAARPGRRRDRLGLSVLDFAPLRLRRELHVRGRHAAGRAARTGALARPRPAEGAARPGGAARPDRPGRARGGRGAAARRARATRTSCTTCSGSEATCGPASSTPRSRSRCSTSAVRSRCGSAARSASSRPRTRAATATRSARCLRAGCPRRSSKAGRTRCRAWSRASPRAAGRSRLAEANDHFGIDVEPVLRALERDERLVRGELRPGGTEREWCDPDVLRRLRRASLAALRKEVEPAERASLGRFLPSWQGIDRRSSLREALVPLQALALPVSLWESEVLPRRVPNYQPAWLDQLCATGELVWVGAGLDRVAVYFRDDAPVLGRLVAADPPEGEVPDRIRAVLGQGAEFWFDLLAAAELEAEQALPALWDLVWSGEVTNDAWTPLRAGRRYGVPRPERRPRRFSRRRSSGITATQGRWSLADRLFRGDPGSPRSRRAPARAAGHRHARRRARRRHRRWLQRGVRRVEGARDTRLWPAGATSSKASAERSSHSAVQWSGCASSARRRARSPTHSCSRPPILPSPTAPPCRGRSSPEAARQGSQARRSSSSAASRRSSSSAAAARSSRSASPDEEWLGPRWRRSSST